MYLRVLSITRAAIQAFLSSVDLASSTTLGWSLGRISNACFTSVIGIHNKKVWYKN